MRNCYWNSRKILILLILILMVPIYCIIDKKGEDNITVLVVNGWIGREIKIPNNFQRNLLRADTGMKVDSDLINLEYRILLYVASVGCMTCKLHLQKWGKLIREFE